jgi:hypothetical protein
MDSRKLQLKHQLRDDLIQIGMKAIRHPFRLLDAENETIKIIEEYFRLIDTRNLTKIKKLVQEHKQFHKQVSERIERPRPHILESCLLRGAETLLALVDDERWLSSSCLAAAFALAWNGADLISEAEKNIEAKYQDSVLGPEIEAAFERVRAAEKELRKQRVAA